VTTATIGIAIDLPEPWRQQLTERRAAAGDPEAAHVSAHLTLLGPTEVESEYLGRTEEHLVRTAVSHLPFRLLLRGTGTFRPVTEVVFISVAMGISECERLHQSIMESPGVHRPQRFPYHPHVTVAHNVAPEQLDAVFDDLTTFQAGFEVRGFTLFEHTAEQRWQERRRYQLGEVPGNPPQNPAQVPDRKLGEHGLGKCSRY
jgi:2'-5' RNA ligase